MNYLNRALISHQRGDSNEAARCFFVSGSMPFAWVAAACCCQTRTLAFLIFAF